MKRLLGIVALVAASVFAPASQANLFTLYAFLSGAGESPPTSPGTGTAIVTLDDSANTMRVQVSFSGLLAGTTASHIHCCTASAFTGNAGVATTTPTFPNFPLNVTSGTYDMTFDLLLASSYNPAFVTAQGGLAQAEAALINGLLTGHTYLNIHTTQFPGGEIRGFLRAPEPSTLALLAMGMLLAVAFARRTAKPALNRRT
jgi:CHRD domain-containing protein/PEP-CTERM motif-containing protein